MNSKNLNCVKKVVIFISIFLVIFLSHTTIVMAAPTDKLGNYPELYKTMRFIKFIIDIIRIGASSIAGLIAAVTGWQVMTKMDGNGLEIAKKNFKDALWGLFFIFAGTSISSFVVGQFIKYFL